MTIAARPQPNPAIISCGTLIVNSEGQLLLCHVTGHKHFDLPKGGMDAGETTLEAACRELSEETGLVLDCGLFQDLGEFHYTGTKKLHLYKVKAPADLTNLDHLVCASHFLHHETGLMRPEMDGYRWVSRDEIPHLCTAIMTARLLALDW